MADAKLDPMDVWVWNQLGAAGTKLTGYPCDSVFEDFTWDPTETMSGASDDWAYEHLGLYGWTTAFWDIVDAATGKKQSTHAWYTGETDAEALAVLRWCDEHHPHGHVDWYRFDHPQLGSVELGGWNDLITWTNPPSHLLRAEVAPHADFAIHQALCSPRLEVPHCEAIKVGDDTWRIEAGIANTGWLPTDVSALARKNQLVQPLVAEVSGDAVVVLDGATRRQFGQLDGRSSTRFRGRNDGAPERVLASWLIRGSAGAEVVVTARHDRAGQAQASCTLN
jgi:hypothetical protein